MTQYPRTRSVRKSRGVAMVEVEDQDVPLDEPVPGEVRRLAAHLAGRGVQLKGPLTLVRTIVTAAVAAEVIEPTPPFPKLWREGRTLPEAPAEAEVAQLLAEAREWLRVAIGLDRSHARLVIGLDVDDTGDEVVITLRPQGPDADVSLERYAAAERTALLAEVLGVPVRVAVEDPRP